jgi:hypothetical protein
MFGREQGYFGLVVAGFGIALLYAFFGPLTSSRLIVVGGAFLWAAFWLGLAAIPEDAPPAPSE